MYFESKYGGEKLYWNTWKSTPLVKTPKVCQTYSFNLGRKQALRSFTILLFIKCALHMLFYNRYSFCKLFVVISKLLCHILTKCTPNMYFRSKYILEETFSKILNIKPLFGLKHQISVLKFTHNNERLMRFWFKICKKLLFRLFFV